jgi:hypothetical protein
LFVSTPPSPSLDKQMTHTHYVQGPRLCKRSGVREGGTKAGGKLRGLISLISLISHKVHSFSGMQAPSLVRIRRTFYGQTRSEHLAEIGAAGSHRPPEWLEVPFAGTS